jgi:enoyl-CoA hydratase
VVVVWLERPDAANALDTEMAVGLERTFDHLGQEVAAGRLGAVVLAGRGPHFCAGLDIDEAARLVGAADATTPGQLGRTLAFIDTLHSALEAVADLPVPVVAALWGHCVGAGLELALAADLRIAASNTVIAAPEVTLGLVADLGAIERLPALIGGGRARELLLTGRSVSAEWSAAAGLVNEVVSDADATLSRAMEVATEIAAFPGGALVATKRILRHAERGAINHYELAAVWNLALGAAGELNAPLEAAQARLGGTRAHRPRD